MGRKFLAILAAGVASAAICAAASAQEVGKAVAVGETVTGQSGRIAVASPVHRDERIRTNVTGLGQFQFNDGTKLAVGPNASVVIDKYVLGEGGKLKQLTVKATQGAFRWISGKSASNAYQIVTPVGSLAIRGTAVDFFVAPSGDTMAVLLNGRARFCLNGERDNCRELTRRCQYVVARRRDISDPALVDSGSASQLASKNAAFPFLSGAKRLGRGLAIGGSCGLNQKSPTPRSDDDNRSGGPERPDKDPGCSDCGGKNQSDVQDPTF